MHADTISGTANWAIPGSGLEAQAQPQPQPPPQHPPAPAPPKLGLAAAPWTAKAESCLSTFPAPQEGQLITCSSLRTSSSK